MDLNKVMIAGNLGGDPEVKFLPSGDPVAEFSVACSSSHKDRQGEWQKETTWVRVVCFGKQADFVKQYFHKGKPIFVEGRLRESRWETPEGQKRSKLDIVAERVQFVGPRGDGGGGGSDSGGGYESGGGGGSRGRSQSGGAPPPDDDYPRGAQSSRGNQETKDDLPF